jgi:PhoPQ-activated pathogenicity-related protein
VFAPLTRVLITSLLCSGLALAQGNQETALDRYVQAPDPSFQYKLVKTIPGPGMTTYVLDMVSQHYLTKGEIDQNEWRHWVIITRPDHVKHSTGLLFITGGSNDNKVPQRMDPFFANLAAKTASVVAELRMVPNQPVSFNSETRRRTEDAIIAYTWDKYLQTSDEKWPLRLPMTKSAVRAMDAVTGFIGSEEGGKQKVDHFVVTGASKRGWTTWATAAVDKRVVGIMPIVIDLLNLEPSFDHHFRTYGFWAPAVEDYVSTGIMDWQGTVEYRNLMKIEDPYEYRDRFTMPKFLVNSAGDQFFLPDSSQFYWSGLKGEKYLRYVPNSDHNITKGTDAAESLGVYYESLLNGWKRPEFDWDIAKDGKITITCKDQPSDVKLWKATNPEARDFRLEKIGPAYMSLALPATKPGVYVVEPQKPEKGFTAYFVELSFPTPSGSHWKFTTGVKVLPDVEPFPAFKPKTPQGAHLLPKP